MFWRRKKAASQDDVSSDHPLLAEARAQFAAGQGPEALGTLRGLLMDQPADQGAHALAAQILRGLGGQDEAKLFEAAAHNPDDPAALYDLGYHFIEVEQPEFALVFLQRAHALKRDPSIASELAIALNASFRPAEAARVLEEVPGPLPFWAAYEHAWASLLSGRRGPARVFLAERVPTLSAQERAEFEAALTKLRAVEARLAVVGPPEPIIRDWHLIQYGAAILDFMDERIAADAWSVAGGRWVMLNASEDKVRAVLDKLARLLAALDLHPQRVAALPDRDAQILGRAAALVLKLPFEDDADVREAGQLLVAAQAADLAEYAVHQVAPGQVTFALNLNWLRDGGFTADVVGLMSQHCSLPWNGGLGALDPETGRLSSPAPDERDPAEIAADLAAAEPEADPDFARHLAFYGAHRDLLTAGRPGARRLPFRRDSPVPGNHFS